MAIEYYATGNVDSIKQIFDYVVMMTGSGSGFTSALSATTLFAFIILLAMGLSRGTLMPTVNYLIAISIVWYGFMLPKKDVIIIDSTNTTNVTVVSNVPLGLALVGNLSSRFGKWYQNEADSIFTEIDDLGYSRTGMVFGAQAYMNTRKLAVLSSTLQTDWSRFVENCTRYDVELYHKMTIEQLQSSSDLLGMLGNTNQALPTTITINGEQNTMFCDQAYSELRQRTNGWAALPDTLNRIAAALNPRISSTQTISQQQANTLLEAMAMSHNQMFVASAKTSLDIIKQEAMINMFNSATLQNAQTTGNQEQMMAGIASAQAELQTIGSHNSVAVMAAKYIPIISTILEALLISLFPIVLILMFIAGSAIWQMALGYATFFFSIKLWPGLFAIVSGISNQINDKDVASIAGAGSTGSTLANYTDILSTANSTQSMAGYILILVPVIAHALTALMKGGLGSAMTSLSGSVSSPAASAGSSTAAGNISVANASWDTYNANKNNIAQSWTDPKSYQINTASGQVQGTMSSNAGFINADGQLVGGVKAGSMTFASTTKSDVGFTATDSASVGNRNAIAAADSQRQAEGLQSQSAQSITSANQQAVSWAINNSTGSGVDNAWSKNISQNDQQSINSVMEKAQNIAESFGKGNDISTVRRIAGSIGGKVGAGVGGGPVSASVSAGADLGLSAEASERYSAQVSQAVSALQKEGVTFSNGFAQALSQSESFKLSANTGNALANSTMASLAQADQASMMASRMYEQARTYSNMVESSVDERVGVNANLTNRATAEMLGNMKNPDGTSMNQQQMLEHLAQNSPAMAGEFAKNVQNGVSPDFSNTVFDTGNASIRPIERGNDFVQAHYNASRARIGDDFDAHSSDIEMSAANAGVGSDFANQINSRGQTIRSGVSSGIQAGQENVRMGIDRVSSSGNQLDSTVQDKFNNMSNAQTVAQRFENAVGANSVRGNESLHFDGAQRSNGQNVQGGVSTDFARNDPKPTASTVVVQTPQKPTQPLRKLNGRWRGQK